MVRVGGSLPTAAGDTPEPEQASALELPTENELDPRLWLHDESYRLRVSDLHNLGCPCKKKSA